MDVSTLTPTQMLIGMLSAGILAGLKALAPTLKDRVPNFVWPLGVLVLGYVGSSVCAAAGAGCKGNPLAWGPVESTALATAFVGIVTRELALYGKDAAAKVGGWLAKGGGPAPLP